MLKLILKASVPKENCLIDQPRCMIDKLYSLIIFRFLKNAKIKNANHRQHLNSVGKAGFSITLAFAENNHFSLKN